MPGSLIDTFFTVTTGEAGLRIGHAVQEGRVARWNWTDSRMYDVDAVPLAQRWPQLPEAFRQGFDAALTTPADNPWTWVFRGGQCLRLHPVDGTVSEVSTIAARFPGLPGAFAQGIDAALPGTGANEVYLFSGNKCARYDLRVPAPVEVKPIAEVWSGLAAKAPEFIHGLDAATFDPGTGNCYLFRGGSYVRGKLATTTIEQSAAPVDNAAWPGLVPAFTRGHVILSSDYPYALDLETGEGVRLGINASGWPTASPDGRYTHFIYPHTQGSWTCYDMVTGQPVWTSYKEPPMRGGRVTFSRDGGLVYFVTPEAYRRYSLTIAEPLEPALVASIPLRDYDATAVETAAVLGPEGPEEQSPRLPDETREGEKDALRFDEHWPVAPPVALGPAGDMAYIGYFPVDQYGHPIGGYRILEVDLTERKVRQTFRLPDAGAPLDIAVDTGGRLAHVAQERGTCAIDLYTGAIAWEGVLPPCRALKFTPDGRELWCLPAADNGGVLVAEPVGHAVVRRIPVGLEGGLGTGTSLDFNHYGTYAYVLMQTGSSARVAVVDVTAHRTTVIHSLAVEYSEDYRLAYTTY
ncbi:hemopexin repeat-containing protein [Streptomyces sp. I05A-00742]|uniref:hemopexin repeat-containing protein n=1 Tax=Streptomyces sp. I05A-00742 TaxID=2732853 RepID=UPI0014899E6F|nr:hemopexin repeat-containing protein [Streptomyces sp. I05A-00742]